MVFKKFSKKSKTFPICNYENGKLNVSYVPVGESPGVSSIFPEGPEVDVIDLKDFVEARQVKEINSKGGRHEKCKHGIKKYLTNYLKENPTAQNKDIWHDIPDNPAHGVIVAVNNRKYKIFRDDNKVYENDTDDGITFGTIQRGVYIPAIKRSLGMKGGKEKK